MTSRKHRGARDPGSEAQAPGDDPASPGAGKKKGKKPTSRDDDPPVVAASQEKALPMSTKAPAKTQSSANAKSAAPDSPEDPLYSFVKNLKPQFPQRAEAAQAESPFTRREPLLPDTGPTDPVAEAARVVGDGLKALASWRLAAPRKESDAGDEDPIWDNLKSYLTWRKPPARKKEKKTWTGGYEPEPEFKVDLLVSAITKSHPDRRR